MDKAASLDVTYGASAVVPEMCGTYCLPNEVWHVVWSGGDVGLRLFPVREPKSLARSCEDKGGSDEGKEKRLIGRPSHLLLCSLRGGGWSPCAASLSVAFLCKEII